MNHRSSYRRAFSASVVINYPALGFICGRARDLSMEGLFVETGRIAIPGRAYVEVHFTAEVDGQPVPHNLGAEVIRAERGGVALKFRPPPVLLSGRYRPRRQAERIDQTFRNRRRPILIGASEEGFSMDRKAPH